ncbi:hypothetical protein G9464_02895 [Halostella sp. JP-L12]|uniref:lipopolysaccharide biosynthesis protein n=1 Tax=Halostella TaxID=1843185 RepID=UPI000EF7CE76|nr:MULTISPECIES: hypothetical protein [Halostella]NHN46545.1 hypothetical protein [Halostella sp. JP-L12]
MAGEHDELGFFEKTGDILDHAVITVRQLLTDDDLLHHGSLLAGATVLSGGLNYAFQIFMGRALGPGQYGVFGALFSLFYLVSVLGSGIRFSASRFTAELKEDGEGVSTLHHGLVFRSFLVGCGIAVLLSFASPVISEFLQLSSVWPVITVAGMIPFAFGVTANMGSFEGLQRFAPLGAYNVLRAGTKLFAGAGLVLLGYGIYGALGAVVIAAATVFTLTTLHIRRQFPADQGHLSQLHQFDYGEVYRFVPPAVLAGFCITVPANADVLLVRHFFPGEQAGLYTAASVLGKVLVFFPTGISTALFPKVTSDYSSGNGEEMYGLLRRALLYTAVTAGSGALVFWIVPTIVLELLFGATYAAAAPLVRWYGVAIFAFVLAVVVLNFQLARDRMRFVYVFAATTVIEIGLMWAAHGSMVRIIQVILIVNAGLFAYGISEVRR